MAPPQQSRVLRCCSCRLFQAHQVKRSLQWTCKACGEKQSLLRTYGEGSGADCRRHVQKLNLLQGQASELSLRSPEDVEGPTGPGPTGGSSSLQGLHTSSPLHGVARPSESRWLKYLDKGPSAHSPEQPGPPCGQTLPSKRRRSTEQPPCSLHVQGLGNTRVTLESQKGLRPAWAELPRGGHLSEPITTVPVGDTPEATWAHRSQQVPRKQLCSLFSTGEDFDDTL
nr:MRN complex-interacting protein isoform X2 [Cavia porcellus]